MDDLDRLLFSMMSRTGDAWNLEMDFPPPNFVSREDAARIHGIELTEHAIVVP